MKTFAPITALITTTDGICPEGYTDVGVSSVVAGGLQAEIRRLRAELDGAKAEAAIASVNCRHRAALLVAALRDVHACASDLMSGGCTHCEHIAGDALKSIGEAP
jgi:hypothetical protein